MKESQQREAERGTQRCTACGYKHRRRSNLLRPCSRCGGEVTAELLPPGPEPNTPEEADLRRIDRQRRPLQRCTDCGHRHHRVVSVGRPCDVCEGEVESVYVHARRTEDVWTPERVAEVLRANREAAISGGREMR
jgi:hypothetical protein